MSETRMVMDEPLGMHGVSGVRRNWSRCRKKNANLVDSWLNNRRLGLFDGYYSDLRRLVFSSSFSIVSPPISVEMPNKDPGQLSTPQFAYPLIQSRLHYKHLLLDLRDFSDLR